MDAEKQFLDTLKVQNYSPETVRTYGRWLGEFKAFIGDRKDLESANGDDVMAYMASKTSSSPNTRKAAYIALRSFYTWLLKTGRIKAPVHVPSVKAERTVVKVLSVETVKRILNKIRMETVRDWRDRALIEMLYVTGMRISEVTALKLEDISAYKQIRSSRDGKRHMRITVHGKGLKQRDLYVNPVSASVLCEYLLKRDDASPYVFSSHTGGKTGRMSANRIRAILRTRASAARVRSDIHPHLFRHSIATHLLERGVNIFVLQKFLGHTSLESTRRYITFLDHDYRSVCEDTVRKLLYRRQDGSDNSEGSR